MRLALALLLLLCVASVGSRGGWGGGGRGGGGRSFGGGGGRSWGGGSRGSSWSRGNGGGFSRGRSNWGGGGRGTSYARGGGHVGGGRLYTAPRSYYGGGVGVRPMHSYTYGSVYGWRYHYHPVYWHGGYSPLIVHPIYSGHYYGCGWGCYYYSYPYNGYTIHYYPSTQHLRNHQKDAKVQCTRPATDLSAQDQEKFKNVTSGEGPPKEIAWACPAKSTCCAWECCKDPDAEDDEDDSWSVWKWVLIAFGCIAGFALLVGCCCWLWCCIRDARDRKYFQTTAPVTPVVETPIYEVPPPAYSTVVQGGYGYDNGAYGTGGYGTGGYGTGGYATYPAQPIY